MSLLRTALFFRTPLPRKGTTFSALVQSKRGGVIIPESSEEWEAAGYEVSSKNGAPKIPSPWNKWFPYEPVPFSPKLGPYIVRVEKDKVYNWCSCGECFNQPFSDDGGCTPPFKPVPYIPRENETVWFCGSKHSPQKPLFDGTCFLVWINVSIIPSIALAFSGCFCGGLFATWLMHP
eukprot:TRINITY_DN7588_c0_g1_i1.p1 TRINITY_DN7588_c0_g1~~TRINITY_DN7588_c0_g1_i1.p1  ORF type:complete len:177 (-),score=19.90 TRINITY_DN7588_c0_g1_i1:806-1336(-)